VTRVAVVGHVEWVDFVQMAGFPPRGAVTHAQGAFTHAGGGGVVAAAVLADLGAEVDFFCALGRDANGRAAAKEMEHRGVRMHVAWRDQPTRRVITLLEPGGRRTIVTIGERLEPIGSDRLDWPLLTRADGVYFTAGDRGAAHHARQARVMVSTPRAREALDEGADVIDALVYSADDEDERRWALHLESRTRLMVETEGAHGGHWWGQSKGRWPAVPLPGAAQDDYGCGDSFAAGIAFGLAQGLPVPEAARIGAEQGAHTLTLVGAPRRLEAGLDGLT
jgi:ribokinase